MSDIKQLFENAHNEIQERIYQSLVDLTECDITYTIDSENNKKINITFYNKVAFPESDFVLVLTYSDSWEEFSIIHATDLSFNADVEMSLQALKEINASALAIVKDIRANFVQYSPYFEIVFSIYKQLSKKQ
jgi:hypothetical protein